MPGSPIRLVGVVLLLLLALPIYRLAPPGAPGSPAEHVRSLAASYHLALWLGVVGVGLVAFLLAAAGLPRRLDGVLSRARDLLLAPGAGTFALGAGAVAGLLTLALSLGAFALQPALLDATSQLIHARYLAAGRLAGPDLPLPEFFTFQSMVNVGSGWASQYPPGHLVLLAMGFRLGAPWVVGPLLAAATVALTARLAEDLLPDPLTARLGGLLLTVSPFFLAQSATYMNHATAAALATLAVLGAVRAAATSRGGKGWLAWPALAGAATGAVVATRPLTGLIAGGVVLAAFRLPSAQEEPSARGGRGRGLLRLAAFGAGAAPPLFALAGYNLALFGHPTTFGYSAAQGPAHGLGFHVDPWGNPYTPVAGLAQTSADLVALGLDLLLTPLSAVLVVAAYLVLAPPGSAALRLVLLWALLPLAAHFFYWHQDLFLGPRLLTEFAPPWAILTAVAVVELAGRARGGRGRLTGRVSPHGVLVSGLVVSAAAALLLLIPQRVLLYRSTWGPDTRPPAPSPSGPALVFVHEDWSARLGARLAARGVRVDSIRAALRHNTSCEIQAFLDGLDAGRAGSPPEAGAAGPPRSPGSLHFEARPQVEITDIRLPSGTVIRTHAGEEPTPACRREVRSDRGGALALPDLSWRGDLPGLFRGEPLFARDLGPDLNPRLLDAHPEREALLYFRPEPAGDPVLLPYGEGVRLLWEVPEPGLAPPGEG